MTMTRFCLFFSIVLVACADDAAMVNTLDCRSNGIGCTDGFVCDDAGGGYECVRETIEADASMSDAFEVDAIATDTGPEATCGDSVQNGEETDVDCGGACEPCADGAACLGAADCQSAMCINNICAVPTCTDTVKNGSEVNVDCGGADCSGCLDGRLASRVVTVKVASALAVFVRRHLAVIKYAMGMSLMWIVAAGVNPVWLVRNKHLWIARAVCVRRGVVRYRAAVMAF